MGSNRFKLVFCFTLLISLLNGCVMDNLSRRIILLEKEYSVLGKVILLDRSLDSKIYIKHVPVGESNRSMQIEISNRKSRAIYLQYKIRWYNEGIVKDGVGEKWLPEFIDKHETTIIKISFPDGKVDKFELLLKEGRNDYE